MTTILACTTPDFVALASDRAVSYGSPTDLPPDRMTKTVALYGQFLLGFAGMAELDGLPVDEWVAATLGGTDIHQWPSTLATRAAAAIDRIPRSSQRKRHAFIAVGFASFRSDPQTWHPLRFVISNAYDRSGRLRDRAASSFSIDMARHPPDRWAHLESFGAPLPEDVTRWAERTLEESYEGSPQGSVQLLGRLISGAAREYPTTVSTACMVSVLPKGAAGTGNVDVPVGTDGYISPDAITCYNYIGNENQAIAYMPVIVFPDGSRAQGGYFGPEGEEPPRPFDNRP
jgi:hypothetical protein